jgi:hypothetical protein
MTRSSFNCAYASAFQALSYTEVYVLGEDGNLWLEHADNVQFGELRWGIPPPPREHVDSNVKAFEAVDANTVYVLGKNGNLWLAHSINGKFGKVPPPREQVDFNVIAFRALDAKTAYVLGFDEKLWIEHSVNGKFGQLPPPRQQVDEHVAAFQPIDAFAAFVLGTDGNLWYEYNVQTDVVPPQSRNQVDGNVAAFQALDSNTVYVLAKDGNLWLEHGGGLQFHQQTQPPPREKVDTNVAAFEALDANNVYVLGKDGKLWIEHSVNGKFGQVPPPREDPTHGALFPGSVDDFQGLDDGKTVFCLQSGQLGVFTPVAASAPSGAGYVDANVNNPLAYATVRPSFMILTIVYAPPGTQGGMSKSTVTYQTGSGSGTTTSASKSFQDGVDISVKVGDTIANTGGSASAEFSYSQSKTDSSSVVSTQSETYSIQVGGPPKDGIDHDEDTFYLWLNPIISVSMDPKNRQNWELGIDLSTQQSMEIVWATVAELKNPSTMSQGLKDALHAAGVTQADYASILSANPFASGAGVIDPKRYKLLPNISMPYEPSDAAHLANFNLQSSATQSFTETTESDVGVSITVSGNSGLFSASLKASFAWKNTNSHTTQNQSSQSATAVVGQPSLGYMGPVVGSVYWDSIYKSFMFTLT